MPDCPIGRLALLVAFSAASVVANPSSAFSAEPNVAGYWACRITYGTTYDQPYELRLAQTGNSITSTGYNEGILEPYIAGTGTIIEGQISVHETSTKFNLDRGWRGVTDGQTITGSFDSSNPSFPYDFLCRRAPDKDAGTSWRCEGPKIFFKGKVISRKNANSFLQKRIDALGKGKQAKVKRAVLKKIKKAVNSCGGA